MTTDPLPTFLYGNKLLDGRWQNGLAWLAGDGADSLGPFKEWHISEAAFEASARGLLLVRRKTDGTGVLALRRPVRGGRPGDQTTCGVQLPAAAFQGPLDALTALQSVDALSPADSSLERLSRESSAAGRPVPMPPKSLADLVAGPLPATDQCHPALVTGLVARLLAWWQSSRGVALDAASTQDVEAYLAAALRLAPPALRRRVTFSTLEPTARGRLAVCGLVRGLDSRIPTGDGVDVLDIRPDAHPPAPTEWDEAAQALQSAVRRPWQMVYLAAARDAEDLRAKARELSRMIEDPTLAPASILGQWVQEEPGMLDPLEDRQKARVALAVPEAFPDGMLSDLMTRPGFAMALMNDLPRNLGAFSDAALRVILDKVGEADRARLTDELLERQARSDFHAGCAEPDCPALQAFDHRFRSDLGFADRALQKGLEPPGTPEGYRLGRWLLGMDVSIDHDRLHRTDWVAYVAAAVDRLGPERVVLRIQQLPRGAIERVIEALLTDDRTYDFAVDGLIPAVCGVDLPARVRLMFTRGSKVYERYGLPGAIAAYASAGDPFAGWNPWQPAPEPRIPLEALAGRVQTTEQLDWLASCMRRWGQDPAPLAVLQLPPNRQPAYAPPDGRPGPELTLDSLLQRELGRSRGGFSLLAGVLLPCVDPPAAHQILVQVLDFGAASLGLGREFPPAGNGSAAPRVVGAALSGDAWARSQESGSADHGGAGLAGDRTPTHPAPAQRRAGQGDPGPQVSRMAVLGGRRDVRGAGAKQALPVLAAVLAAVLVVVALAVVFTVLGSRDTPSPPAQTPAPSAESTDPKGSPEPTDSQGGEVTGAGAGWPTAPSAPTGGPRTAPTPGGWVRL